MNREGYTPKEAPSNPVPPRGGSGTTSQLPENSLPLREAKEILLRMEVLARKIGDMELVRHYLDDSIARWRIERDNSYNSTTAEYYIDAYQSVRSNLFGEPLPQGTIGIRGTIFDRAPVERKAKPTLSVVGTIPEMAIPKPSNVTEDLINNYMARLDYNATRYGAYAMAKEIMNALRVRARYLSCWELDVAANDIEMSLEEGAA